MTAQEHRTGPQAELIKEYRFEAAHQLPHVPSGHQCGRLHGHSYEVRIHVTGPIDPNLGWVVDFAHISSIMKPIIATLDHACLNEVPGLANPTSESLAQWLWSRVSPHLPLLSAITVRETATSMCVFRGPGTRPV